MNEQPLERGTTGAVGAEWFAAWLPKTDRRAQPSLAFENAPALEETVMDGGNSEASLDEVRNELKTVTAQLRDPTTKGIRSALPHLERAVEVFGGFIKTDPATRTDLSVLQPSIDALRAELALANMLFENAYTLQAGWAAHLGLNLDGTAKQLLYTRPGGPAAAPLQRGEFHENWEG